MFASHHVMEGEARMGNLQVILAFEKGIKLSQVVAMMRLLNSVS